jgi:hypothetical protein
LQTSVAPYVLVLDPNVLTEPHLLERIPEPSCKLGSEEIAVEHTDAVIVLSVVRYEASPVLAYVGGEPFSHNGSGELGPIARQIVQPFRPVCAENQHARRTEEWRECT